MNSFSANYEKFLGILQQTEQQKNFLSQIRIPKLSDIKLIAIDITAEYLNIDSEYQLFRKLTEKLSALIEKRL